MVRGDWENWVAVKCGVSGNLLLYDDGFRCEYICQDRLDGIGQGWGKSFDIEQQYYRDV